MRPKTNGKSRSARRREHTLPPQPVVCSPPRDPPTISASRARVADVLIRGSTPSTIGSGHIFTYSGISDQIRSQYYGGTVAAIHFSVLQIWVYIANSASASATLTDSESGVTSYDAGSLADRCKVGLKYPPTLQLTRSSGSITGNLASLQAANGTPFDAYIRVKFWSEPTVTVGAATATHSQKKSERGLL